VAALSAHRRFAASRRPGLENLIGRLEDPLGAPFRNRFGGAVFVPVLNVAAANRGHLRRRESQVHQQNDVVDVGGHQWRSLGPVKSVSSNGATLNGLW
jgi:hypothetical protein